MNKLKFIWTIDGRKFKHYFIIAVALLFTAGILYSEQANITLFTTQNALADKEPQAVYKVDTDQNVVALTFDISWGDIRAEPILKILEEKGIKATFFLSSPWSQSHPEMVQRIQDLGFEIGSHGHIHKNYSTFSDEEIRTQIRKADNILSELTGTKPNLIRMPNGDFDKRVLRVADSLGYTVIQWQTDSLDWMNPGVDKIINRVVTKVIPGDIILMHASDSCKQTHEALPTIIDQLIAKGYEFTTVSELIAGTKIETNTVE